MLSNYLHAAMCHAHYEILSDDNSFYGEIPICNGVFANAPTLEACRDELAEVLEEWVLFRIHKNLALPGNGCEFGSGHFGSNTVLGDTQ